MFTSQRIENMSASAITHTNGFECGVFTAGLTHGGANWLRLCYRMTVYYPESSADADRQTALSITTSATTMTQLLREPCAAS